jgi:hypothetical protein
LAMAKNCQGIICGHIHTPADKHIGGIHYLNSGDWVETLSCIFEHCDGIFEVVHYEELLTRLEIEPDEGSESEGFNSEEISLNEVFEDSEVTRALAKQILVASS